VDLHFGVDLLKATYSDYVHEKLHEEHPKSTAKVLGFCVRFLTSKFSKNS
jgi:hypothetical protein